jgi:hypothetical protein
MGSCRNRLAISIACLAYGLFYLVILGLVMGIPIGLAILLAWVLLN